MAEGRALLTDREREALAGDKSDNYRYKTRTYFRDRLERLAADIEHLEEHEPELLEELRDVVCPTTETKTEEELEATIREELGERRAHTDSAAADADTPELVEVVERVADGWEDSEERLEARKRAAVAVLRYAREHGTVSKSEAKEEVYPEHPVEGQAERTWYRKNIRPVLNEAAEYDSSKRGYRLDVA
jgi:predicted house-cleaning noncanonical NTP pyrophosphatase (MazG superfamily)